MKKFINQLLIFLSFTINLGILFFIFLLTCKKLQALSNLSKLSIKEIRVIYFLNIILYIKLLQNISQSKKLQHSISIKNLLCL